MYSIIGAGIAGLTLANAFEKLGIEYHLYERVSGLKEVGAGIWLAPNALQVLEWLGLLNQIQKAGNNINHISIGKADLSFLSDNNQQVMKDKFGYSSVAIHRAKLQQILFDNLSPHNVLLAKDIDDYSHQGESVKINFNDGSTAESKYLIAADGIHSKVRKILFPESKIRYTGQTCWRGISTINLPKQFQNRGSEFWGGKYRFGFSKISEAKVYWFAVALAAEHGKDNLDHRKDKLLDAYSYFHPMILDIIKSTPNSQIIRNDIHDLKPMTSWHQGNICLIGDAAHATTPNMGQGGAQAIEDAYALSNIIAKGENDPFQKFYNRRQKKVNMIVNQSWSTGKMAHWQSMAWLRNLLIKSLPSKLMEKKMLQLYTLESL